MLIRHSNDGKLYLYDVIDIKKKRATLSANKRLPDKNPFPLGKYNTTGNDRCQSEYSKIFLHTEGLEMVILLR